MIENKYICDVCKETVSNPDALIRITYRVHKGDDPFTCTKSSCIDLCKKCYREYSKLFGV